MLSVPESAKELDLIETLPDDPDPITAADSTFRLPDAGRPPPEIMSILLAAFNARVEDCC